MGQGLPQHDEFPGGVADAAGRARVHEGAAGWAGLAERESCLLRHDRAGNGHPLPRGMPRLHALLTKQAFGPTIPP